jgi:hypothetical protein
MLALDVEQAGLWLSILTEGHPPVDPQPEALLRRGEQRLLQGGLLELIGCRPARVGRSKRRRHFATVGRQIPPLWAMAGLLRPRTNFSLATS